MMKGKTWKLVKDEKAEVKGVYLRDLPAMASTVVAETAVEWWQENRANVKCFAGGAVVAILAVFAVG